MFDCDQKTIYHNLQVAFRKDGAAYARESVCWGSFIALALLVLKFFSNASFSAILTLSSGFQCLAFTLLQLRRSSAATLVSTNYLIIICAAMILRTLCNIAAPGYLPVDSTGDFIIHLLDVYCAISVMILIYHTKSQPAKRDQSTLPVDQIQVAVGFVVFSLVFGFIFHCDVNGNTMTDRVWMASVVMECLAVIPQILVLSQHYEALDAPFMHFFAAYGVSRVLSTIFWLSTRKELSLDSGSLFPATIVVGCYFIQCIAVADYLWLYFKAIRKGSGLILGETSPV